MCTTNREYILNAEVAKLADALPWGGSGSNTLWVQIPPSALSVYKENIKDKKSQIKIQIKK